MVYGELAREDLTVVRPEEDVGLYFSDCVTEVVLSKAADLINDVVQKMGSEGV